MLHGAQRSPAYDLKSAYAARRGFTPLTPLVAGKRLTKSGPGQYRRGHAPLGGMFSKVIENYIHRSMDGNVLRRANRTLRIKHGWLLVSRLTFYYSVIALPLQETTSHARRG